MTHRCLYFFLTHPPSIVNRPFSTYRRFLPDSYLFIHVSALTCSTRLAPTFLQRCPYLYSNPFPSHHSPPIFLAPRLSAFPFATCMPTPSSSSRPSFNLSLSPSLTSLSPEDRPPLHRPECKHHLRRARDSTCALPRDKARFKLRLRVGAFQLARTSPGALYCYTLPLYNDFPPPPPTPPPSP